jgi:hypothetical protein
MFRHEYLPPSGLVCHQADMVSLAGQNVPKGQWVSS